MHLYEHQIATNASQQMIKVTEMVREDIERSGVREGIAVIFSPHTTAGFTINENADPDVVHDMLCGFEKVFPAEQFFYQHAEGNSHAHMKTTACCMDFRSRDSATTQVYGRENNAAAGSVAIRQV